jgi:stage IV sporulation protein A
MDFTLPLKDDCSTASGEECGTEIHGDAHLLALMKELVAAKAEYDHVADALRSVRETGYGLVTPAMSEMTLQEPEIVRQGSRFGVKLKAHAPSLHMIRVDIETEVTPVVGTEKQSEELVRYLLEDFENDPQRIGRPILCQRACTTWCSRFFRTTDAHACDAQQKVQETLPASSTTAARNDLHPSVWQTIFRKGKTFCGQIAKKMEK